MRNDVPYVEERNDTEDVVTPLVCAVYECADEAADDNDERHEDRGHDVRKGETRCQEHGQQEGGEGNEPLDVPHILKIGGEFTSAEDISC